VSVWGAVLGVLALCAGAGALIARKLNALSPLATCPARRLRAACSSPTRDSSPRKLKTPAHVRNSPALVVGFLSLAFVGLLRSSL
jgi:hypothetical protein